MTTLTNLLAGLLAFGTAVWQPAVANEIIILDEIPAEMHAYINPLDEVGFGFLADMTRLQSPALPSSALPTTALELDESALDPQPGSQTVRTLSVNPAVTPNGVATQPAVALQDLLQRLR